MSTYYGFTKEEKEVIKISLESHPCHNGCVVKDMQNSNKDCDECWFNLTLIELLNKLDS